MMEPEIYTHLQNVHEETHHPTILMHSFFFVSLVGREIYYRVIQGRSTWPHLHIVPTIKHEIES